ncbi:polyprenyl synthetase family protein [Streptomyces yerevanensis]|uniref:polyprenyl synthetase family protein n=1 Tax=Streptomyces yerevanensis TaxID=66378 RepID=UPI000524180E|nr:polyprenyl synthetase family protein [Streptomyces yerevanensis]
MNSISYLDLYRQFSSDIDAELKTGIERLGPSSTAIKNAVTELLQHQKFKYPLQVLPLLVHAAETGDPGPAVPLSAVHVLWWTSACYLDDLADGQAASVSGALGKNEALLASITSGNALPLHIIQAQQVPDSVRSALAAELVTCAIVSTEGQLSDLRRDAGDATRDSVVTTYRGKSGAPFGMITAMGAILAGAEHERIRMWREFGDVFGILWQLFNDQEDILSGRNEDLRNGTITYLFACTLENASPRSRNRLLDLHAAAKNSEEARPELTALLLAPTSLQQYEADLRRFRDEAQRLLTELGGDGNYVPVLRHLVEESAELLLHQTE